MNAGDEVVDAKEEAENENIDDEAWEGSSQPVPGNKPNVESKKNKKLLILFPHTIVDPRAVVIHLLDASGEENVKHQDRNNGTHLWQTEQWWALSGLMLQHFGHLKITWGYSNKNLWWSMLSVDFGDYTKGTEPRRSGIQIFLGAQ